MAISIKTSGVYEILNAANGKRYIGSARNCSNRWASHRMRLRRGDHHSKHLQFSWNKHGEDRFSFRVLLVCAVSDLIFYEQAAIDAMRPEYNKAQIAGSPLGVKHSPETRAKLSRLRKGNTFGRDYAAKISAALMGHQVSASTREKMRAAKIGKPSPRKGARHTLEARARMSQSLRGRVSPAAKRVVIGSSVYESAQAASAAIGVSATCLRAMLRGENRNRLGARYES